MNNNELNNFYRKFSLRTDGYIKTGAVDNLKSMDQLCDQYILDYPQIACCFWYCKANVASALLQLEDLKVDLQNTDNKVKHVPTIQIDLSWKPLIYLRQAIQHDSFQKCPPRFKAMILTNTGNALCSAKRFIEAIEYYDRATAYIPLFSVALYSRGKTFYQLANWMALNPEIKADPAAIDFLYVEAKNNFDQAFQQGAIWETHPDNIEAMRKEYYEHLLPYIHQTQALGKIKGYKFHSDDFFKGSAKETAYKKWSLNEHLYLDQISLISTYDIGGYDYLPLPPHLYRKGEQLPEFFNWFRLLKQEYIAARYLLFQAIELKDKKHFVDENIDLFPSNEAELTFSDNTERLYKSNFSFTLETAFMKSSFSKAYGIFDKIAEFIFSFWQLEVKKKNGEINKDPVISIGNVWYNNLEIRRGLNTNLVNENNWFLKGLHHLSYDIVGKEIPQEYILPEFKQLHEIRNKLEHSGVMITEDKRAISSQRLMTISREEFIKHNLSLLRLVRNTLFYLSMAVGLDQYNLKNKK